MEFQDKNRMRDCARSLVWTAEGTAIFRARFQNDPQRCKTAAKARGSTAGGGGVGENA